MDKLFSIIMALAGAVLFANYNVINHVEMNIENLLICIIIICFFLISGAILEE